MLAVYTDPVPRQVGENGDHLAPGHPVKQYPSSEQESASQGATTEWLGCWSYVGLGCHLFASASSVRERGERWLFASPSPQQRKCFGGEISHVFVLLFFHSVCVFVCVCVCVCVRACVRACVIIWHTYLFNPGNICYCVFTSERRNWYRCHWSRRVSLLNCPFWIKTKNKKHSNVGVWGLRHTGCYEGRYELSCIKMSPLCRYSNILRVMKAVMNWAVSKLLRSVTTVTYRVLWRPLWTKHYKNVSAL